MKTVVLISSIFFLLGLKISNKVDLVKKAGLTPVVTNKIDCPEKSAANTHFQDEAKSKTDIKISADSSRTAKASVIRLH